jgi:hypothetical protein
MSPDPHAALRDNVLATVLTGPGETAPALRESVARNENVPAELQSLIDKIQQHAYRVTDEDVARVQSAYGDDKAFEIIVSAALGASRKRLLAGLAALENA